MMCLATTALNACAHAKPVSEWRTVAAEDLLLLETATGTIAIELAEDTAPRHTAQVRAAVRAGIYDNEFFYRVIENHVAQAGLEFESRGADWPTLPFEAEHKRSSDGFTPLGNQDLFASRVGHRQGFAVGREKGREWLLHCPGALGMARDQATDTGSLDFYIPIAPRRYLDRNFTVFGRVIDGIAHVHRLARVDPVSEEDAPKFFTGDQEVESAFATRAQRLKDNRILSARIAADLPPESRPSYDVMRADGAAYTALKTRLRVRKEDPWLPSTPPEVVDICSVPVPARRHEPVKKSAKNQM